MAKYHYSTWREQLFVGLPLYNPVFIFVIYAVVDLRGLPLHAPTYGPKFSRFPAVFLEILTKLYLGAPTGSAPPPAGNPGSTPGMDDKVEAEPKTALTKYNLPVIVLGDDEAGC